MRGLAWWLALGLVAVAAGPAGAAGDDRGPPAGEAKAGETAAGAAESAFDRRVQIERATRDQPFALSPHRPNYALPLTWNARPNEAALQGTGLDRLQNLEVKFQLSIKFPVVEGVLGDRGTLYFAYTNLSFWQAYNTSESSPFRETNHEPELFLALPLAGSDAWLRPRAVLFGLSHQSNGRGGPQSRSWNRIWAQMILEHGDWYLGVKPWYRIPESRATDDNPDIEHYLGHGELYLVYAPGPFTLSLTGRTTLGPDHRGALQVNWSLPVTERVKLFVQGFEGYGESLLDYNVRTRRIGVGFALTDWL